MRYFLVILILLLSCTTLPEDVHGCTNSNACNYNPDANEDDGSCTSVPDMCGICDNDSSNDCVQDCAGIWGGNTAASFCDICISNVGQFDCSGNCCKNDLIYDIDSLLETSISCSIEDKCGVCNGDGWNSGLSCEDLFPLKQIIDANDFSVTSSAQNESEFHEWDLNSNGLVDPWEFGVQNWSEEGRLIYLKVNMPIILTDDIGALKELTELILETSGLTTIPETIGNLQKLKILSLASNSISLLPEKVIELTNLEELLISKNNILLLPENIGNLTKLKKLDVANNRLTALPDNIGSLNQLKKLFLENNQINVLPATFTNLSNLIELRLYSNKLAELPESFGGYGVLLDLFLNDNLLSRLSDNFGSMNNLKRLRLNSNKLDSLPESIGNFQNLEELWLQKNQLVTLPDEIGDLDHLKYLYLDNNQLEWLPDELCNIYSGLEDFSAKDNSLCALTVPNECISYENDVGNQNCLTGDCPPHHFEREGYCVYVSDYNILQNFLDLNPESQSLPAQTGIPNEARHCVNDQWWDEGRLVEISFQHKHLNSTIPENIGDLDKLEILRLTGNKLTGDIPDNITNLNNLNTLRLNNNYIGCYEYDVGEDKCVEHCNDTEECSGTIPEYIGLLTELDTLWLHDNNLSGEIPQSITNLNNLEELKLEENNLIGSIPYNIGDLDSLSWLSLDNNDLEGEIPQSIGNLTNLRRVYLLNNNLSGKIPESICNIYAANGNFQALFHWNKLCPPYPECVPIYDLGLDEDDVIKQDTTNCNE